MNILFTELLNNNLKWKLGSNISLNMNGSDIQENAQNAFDQIQDKYSRIYRELLNTVNTRNYELTQSNQEIQKLEKTLKQKRRILSKHKENLGSTETKILSSQKSIQNENEKNKKIKIYLIISYIMIIILVTILFKILRKIYNLLKN